MLISKPNKNTLFSLLAFVIVDFSILVYLILTESRKEIVPVYMHLIIGILLLMGITVLIKIALSYKILTIKQQKITVKYPLRLKKSSFKLNDLNYWQETSIKTNRQVFKELKLKFDKRNSIRITLQENTNYAKVVAYLKKNASKKETRN